MMGFLVAGSIAAVAQVSASARTAVVSSVRSEQADMRYALQTGEPTAREALADVPEMVAVRDSSAVASVEGFQIPLLVRTTSHPALPVGQLIAGRRASQDSEATVSRAVRDALGIDLGSSIELRRTSGNSTTVLVVGTTVNTADADERAMTTYDGTLTPDRTTVWLTDRDPSEIATLRSFLERRVITVQGVSSLAAARSLTLPAGLAQFARVPLGLGILLLVVAAAAAAAFYPLARQDAESLVAAGVPARTAWRVLVGLGSVSLVLGECAGAAAAVTGVNGAKERISSVLGQYWVETTIPWRVLAMLILATLAIPLLASPARSLGRQLAGLVESRTRISEPSSARALLALSVGVALMGLALIGHLQSPPTDLVRSGPLAVVLIAAGLPGALAPLIRRGAPPATARYLRHISAGLLLVTASSLVLAVGLAVHGATTTHDTRAFEAATRVPQPSGSLVITEVPAHAAATLLDEYAARGGSSTAQWELPDESHSGLRVTSPRLIACMDDLGAANPSEVPDECFPRPSSPP